MQTGLAPVGSVGQKEQIVLGHGRRNRREVGMCVWIFQDEFHKTQNPL